MQNAACRVSFSFLILHFSFFISPSSSYAVIPLVRAMNAVSRLISSSLNSVSLYAALDQDRGQVAVVRDALGQSDK